MLLDQIIFYTELIICYNIALIDTNMVLYRQCSMGGLKNMLRISKLTDYATVILTFLALQPSQIISAAVITKACRLSLPTVRKLLKILAEAGLVIAFRGTEGGYQLARSITEITIADVVIAIEGKLAITECCLSTHCSLDAWCAVKENWKHINKMILNTLAGVKLSDMIRPLPIIRSLQIDHCYD